MYKLFPILQSHFLK